jgi:phenylalanyl-tRNA synthetase alpha chain
MQALSELVEAAAAEIDAASDLAALDAVRVSYLGKKGKLTERLKSLSQLPAEDRPAAGQEINQAKQEVMGRINARRETLESAALEERLAKDAVDVTLPGRGYEIGGRHPVTRAMSRIETIFRNAGFGVRSGPEIEDDFHNFTALNIPENGRWWKRAHPYVLLRPAASTAVIPIRRIPPCSTRSRASSSTAASVSQT